MTTTPSASTPAPTPQNTSTDAELRLTGVLASSLPHDVGTAGAPERYTVPAVFSRRPEPREIELIQHPDVARRLGEAGYDGVGLEVSDRRLLITGTNLDELKAGLASVVARILHDISVTAANEKTQRAEELDALGQREQHRADAVREAAAEVHFTF